MTPVTMHTEQTAAEFNAPRTMTPDQLGDTLARLVWENFTDFIAEGDAEVSLEALGVPTDDGVPVAHAAEEALIFLMWAHTRSTQLAFMGRTPDALLREGLDSMHRAIFEDMEGNGTPPAQLPLFEQRVGARYAEYHQASAVNDRQLGNAVVRHICEDDEPHQALGQAVTVRAVAVANPLRDFLEDVDLIGA
ncbi:MAG: hypothetical protein KJP18_15610 [Gemmatimonadetes bacterium]|nr:hypothetical protein [Gemmatimonadota bacterium]